MALTQFNQWEPQLDPVNGVMQQEPRVFGHDAKLIVIGAINNTDSNHGLNMTSGGTDYEVDDEITVTTSTVTNIDIPNTQKRGCCFYIGDITAGAQLKVVMEAAKHDGTAGTGYAATDTVTFEGVLAGGTYPILIKQLVYNATGPTSVVALY